MGDIGAMLLGLLLAYGPISSTNSIDPALLNAYRTTHPLDRFPTILPLLMTAAIFVIPYTDLMFAIIRRTRAGQPIMVADRQHLHHRLLNIGHSYRQSVLIMYLWAALFSGTVVALSVVRSPSFVFVAATVVAVLTLLPVTMPRLRPWRARKPAPPPATPAPPASPPPRPHPGPRPPRSPPVIPHPRPPSGRSPPTTPRPTPPSTPPPRIRSRPCPRRSTPRLRTRSRPRPRPRFHPPRARSPRPLTPVRTPLRIPSPAPAEGPKTATPARSIGPTRFPSTPTRTPDDPRRPLRYRQSLPPQPSSARRPFTGRILGSREH